jgi:hypothetical protein
VNPSHWTQILSALLTPTIAVVVAMIAYRQWRTAQNRLKLDLFDRRFAVYDAARNLISSILTSGKVKDEETLKFLTRTREVKWLLNDGIAEYFDKEIWGQAVELETLDTELQILTVQAERVSNVKKRSEIKKWFRDQYKVLDEKFTPFLNLKH